MDKKIYQDPLIYILFGSSIVVSELFRIATDQTSYYLGNLAAVLFISFIVYLIARPFLKRKNVKPASAAVIAILAGFIILAILGIWALSAGL